MKDLFNWIDAGVAAILLLGLIGGIRRGLSGEIWRVVAFVAGGWTVWSFTPGIADRLEELTQWPAEQSYLAAAIALFVAVLLGFWLIGKLIKGAMSLNFKGKLERIGGGLCGLMRAVLVSAFLLLLAGLIPQPEAARYVKDGSLSGRFFEKQIRPRYNEWTHGNPALSIPADGNAVEEFGEITDEFGAGATGE